MRGNIYLYVLTMAVVTYLIRALPLTLLRKRIKSRFIKSFLFYVPYVTLAVMTFPAILNDTGSLYSAIAAFVTALFLAWKGKSLLTVAVSACAAVLIVETGLRIIGVM